MSQTKAQLIEGLNVNTSAPADSLVIDSSGNVGLGNNSPSTILDVNGDVTITDKIIHSGDTNTAIRFPAADTFAVETAGTERLRVDSSGNVGIGTTNPDARFDIGGNTDQAKQAILANGSDTNFQLASINESSANSAGAAIATFGGYYQTTKVGAFTFYRGISSGAGQLSYGAGSSEFLRIDGSGRLLVGTSSARTDFATTPQIQLEGNGFGESALSITRNDTGAGRPTLFFGKSSGNTNGSTSLVSDGDGLGTIEFAGADGSSFVRGAFIAAQVDGTPGANDMPGRLVFSTTADGQNSPDPRMTIDSSGHVLINASADLISADELLTVYQGVSTFGQDNGAAVIVNRGGTDGDLVLFYHSGVQEGTISVSGTTVSLNGAHLSRWSQLPGRAERTEILRGTVLSNIDEMCAWGEEDNEQLNRMKVSDVEGDRNVSGVFQGWDNDDDTYTDDFYCAMTGDFIIRIAGGVTVQRGDLLMSAGDGTAKPQDDDIIRSKTVAKVTSTHVTCTYDDGSYCVPCVLMAC